MDVYRATVLEADRMAAALASEEAEGPVEILVAVFDVPDTSVAIGAHRRQVIDRGAFADFIGSHDFERNPVPIFADHGMAFASHGVALASHKIGKATSFRETDEGLVVRGTYNLRKQIARDLYSDLLHDPEGSRFSFRAPIGEETYRGSDGYEHVARFERVEEISQVGIAAQERARLLALRAAIAVHHTATEQGRWDAAQAVRRLPNDAQALRRAHAWVDPDGDPEAKSSYKFPHHEVSASGEVGPANVTACRAGIAVLNGARGGADVPEADREAIWRHLAAHLRDAGMEPPELRSTLAAWGWTREEVRSLLAEPAFRAALVEAARGDRGLREEIAAPDPVLAYELAVWESLRRPRTG